MRNAKELILRSFGDHGAETLERYYAQIEYTAYWCIALLDRTQFLKAVIPEGIDDVVLVRESYNELHQVKTRDESQGPWGSQEVFEILCQQYYRDSAFDGECTFHFVSNQMADTNKSKKLKYGSLYRLKELLEIIHDGFELNNEEKEEFETIELLWIDGIVEYFGSKFQNKIGYALARSFLERTWIETDSALIRKPNNLVYLQQCIGDNTQFISTKQSLDYYREIYLRLINLIILKIINGKSLEDRTIRESDVIDCHPLSPFSKNNKIDWDNLPGKTLLEKKALLGGFDSTELPMFIKQSNLSRARTRELNVMGVESRIENLTVEILDLQHQLRHKICRENNVRIKPGPKILAAMRTELPVIINKFDVKSVFVDEQFCLGLLWHETDNCSAYWHSLDYTGGYG